MVETIPIKSDAAEEGKPTETTVIGYREKEQLERRVGRMLTKLLFQHGERFGIWSDEEPRRQLLDRIANRLYEKLKIPRGEMIGIDAPEINAFVAKGRPEVYSFVGLLRGLARWCQRHGEAPTEDMVAMIIAHELTHVDQGTEEEGGETEKDKRSEALQKRKNAEYDADRGGLILMARAGFNPREGLRTIQFLTSLGEGLPLFSTHPRSVDRERELEELVNSPDTFLPSINVKPTPLTADMHEHILSEGNRPGTRLYRKDGIENIEELMAKTDNLHDALEVAFVAARHDHFLLAEFERRKEYARAAHAQLMVINTLHEITVTIYDGTKIPRPHLDLGAGEYSAPTNHERYIDHEFNYAQRGDDPGFHHTSLQEKRMSEVEATAQILKKNVRAMIEELQEHIAKAEEPSEIMKAAFGKLQTVEQHIDSTLTAVTADTLKLLIVNAVVPGPQETVWSNRESSRQYVQHASAEELLAEALSSGTIYFLDKAYTIRERIKQKTAEAASFESQYEPFLEAPILAEEDLTTQAGRQQFIDRILFQWASDAIEQYTDEAIKKAFALYTQGNPVQAFDGQPMPEAHTERILPQVIDRFEKRYAALLNPEHARALAKFMGPHTVHPKVVGYSPDTLMGIAVSLSKEEAERVLRDLVQPLVEVRPSADAQFMAETHFDKSNGIELIYGVWEGEFIRMVRERVEQEWGHPLTPEERLQKLHYALERSGPEALYLYQQELMTLLMMLEVQSFEDLRTHASPILNLIEDESVRNHFLEIIIDHFDNKLPPSELLRFLEGEDEEKIWDYFHRVWDSDRRDQLPEEEQLRFMDTLIDILPQWSEKIIKYDERLFSQRENDAQEYANRLSADYLKLSQRVQRDGGFVKALKRLFKDGYLKIHKDSKWLADDQEVHNVFMELSAAELQEIALYCVEIDGKQKKVELFLDWGYHQNERPAIASIIDRCIDEKNNNVRRHGWKVFDVEHISLQENLQFLITSVPAPLRDSYINQCLKDYGLDTAVEQLVESDDLWPGGVARLYEPIRRDAYYQRRRWYEMIPTTGLDAAAAQYDPTKPNFTTMFERTPWTSSRYSRIDRYLHYWKDRHNLIGDTSRSPEQRAKALLALIPETTNYRDTIFAEIEEAVLKELGLTTKGHAVVAPDGAPIPVEQAQTLYNFYACVIPALVDTSHQQLWSRRADQLCRDYLMPTQTTFSDELQRLTTTYPHASFVRDAALMRLGDSALVQTPDQGRIITDLLFSAQRRTTEEHDITQQSQLEKIKQLIALMGRNERKDLLLWILGATQQPPLTLRAFGSHNVCSVEDIPQLIFAATPEERAEFFLPLLQGENGVMDPRTGEDMAVFDSLLTSSFNKLFPEDTGGINATGRKILQTVFNTTLKQYSGFRRSRNFIAMIEVLRGQGETSVGERIRTLLEALGPVAIKAGQVISEEEIEPGIFLLPDDIRSEIWKLKQKALTFHRTAALQVLETAKEFDPSGEFYVVSLQRQLAAASIKQVYTALLSDGTTAVEKVRRPSIGKHLEEDIRVLSAVMADLAEITEIPEGLAERISRWVRDEANFEIEVQNHSAVGETLERYTERAVVKGMRVRVPKIYSYGPEHIREEFIRGLSLQELMESAENPDRFNELAVEYGLSENEKGGYAMLLGSIEDIRVRAFDALIYQMLAEGRFHSDLHSGNIIITPEGETVFIDIGSAGEISAEKLNSAKQFFLGFVGGNPEWVQMGTRTFVPDIDERQLAEVLKIAASDIDDRDKFNRIMITISKGGRAIDEGFEKFLKGLATGAYLSRGIDRTRLAPSVIAYGQLA